MLYVKIGGTEYPAEIGTRQRDPNWDWRDSASVTLEMSCDEAKRVWRDGVPWSMVIRDEDGQKMAERDMSEYSEAGDVTDHRDGTVTVKMGIPQQSGVTEAQAESAYREGVENA